MKFLAAFPRLALPAWTAALFPPIIVAGRVQKIQGQKATAMDLTRFNPTGRFSDLADLYARHRPDYPAGAVDRVIERGGLAGDALLVDVGCGTGISSRQFAERGVRVLGVEPNDSMRARARQVAPRAGPAPEYRPGRAEATGLPDGVAQVVLAAQAFHWFDAHEALKEFDRVLRRGGWVALMWNERDESDPCTAAYGAVIRTAPEAASVEGPRARAGEVLLHSPLFESGERVCFPHTQELDEGEVLGRAFSASYAPREPGAAEAFARGLREVFARFESGGRVVLRYETALYLARRKG
jgi:SAM-dependent methyltransferase